MRIDRLLLCFADVSQEVAEQDFADAAAAFVGCGGVLTLEEFASLSPKGRQAIAEARRADREALVASIAMAVAGGLAGATKDAAQDLADRIAEEAAR